MPTAPEAPPPSRTTTSNLFQPLLPSSLEELAVTWECAHTRSALAGSGDLGCNAAPPHTCCVTLGVTPSLSEAQFPPVGNRNDSNPYDGPRAASRIQ